MDLLFLDLFTILRPLEVNSNLNKFDLDLVLVLLISPSFSILMVCLEITFSLRSASRAILDNVADRPKS